MSGGPGAENPSAGAANAGGSGPERAGLVLVALVLAATIANLNLSVANVALPTIGKAFDASQSELTWSRSGTAWAWPPRCSTWALSVTATDAS